ncbi:response regulator transcription factor [Streptomyces sp. F63]|uniref:response regulator transcription factor n=1 Tax=Streptomyces sp. F63 TaxID=2824887 RepID=UPI001B35885D|nr:response regulator transcription factor [Streptomyces sp. F63]MBQ0984996.1 response regulator transcription factor [Streptomyces sp. F63]
MIRVLLVHDIGLLRSALAALLGREQDLEVTAATWDRFPAQARATRPDVCVVDADNPASDTLSTVLEAAEGESGAAAEPGGRGRRSALLALVTAGRPGALRRAFDASALGYVSKNATPQRLLHAIRKVSKGERFVDESLAFGFMQAAEMPLTARELSVLSLAAEGAPIAEIAKSLHLCNGTVRNYMASVIRKTGARNRIDAVRISQSAGWV